MIFSAHEVRDMILWIAGLLILASFAAVITWDWFESRKINGLTISKRALRLWKANMDKPAFWLALGAIIGFGFGLPLGFVLGHLFWPQVVRQP